MWGHCWIRLPADEDLYLTFGINLLLTILDENPELQTQEFADEIRALILETVELEKAYVLKTYFQWNS